MNDSARLVQAQFGAHADKYVTSTVHAQGESLKRLVELVQPQKDWRALDVSTGGGHTALAFAPFVREVIASDLTPAMLEAAEKFIRDKGVTNVEFKIADAANLPFGDAEFDLVTNRIALHHYPNARQALGEMVRVCKRGGLLGFTDNIVPPDKVTAGHVNHWEKMRDPSHHWEYPMERLQDMFTDAGVSILHTESLEKEMEFDPWADRMGARNELKASLRQWMANAPEPVRAWLKPRHAGENLYFTLHEVVIVGRKN